MDKLPYILNAVQSGDHGLVEKYLLDRHDPNTHHGNDSALSIAVTKKDNEMCMLLLRHGANPNQCAASWTPAHIAAHRGYFDILLLLIPEMLKHKRHNLDFVNMFGKTILIYVIEHGNYDVVQFLLENKASTNIGNSPTPLQTAIKNGHHDIVRLLLKNRADPHGTDSYLRTPMYYVLPDDREMRELLSNA